MYRIAQQYLSRWKIKSNRKPLVIRGARQVGKTYLVRSFARKFVNLVEINFERNPEIGQLFSSNDPEKIIRLLGLQYNQEITPGNTLVFLDEIQARPEVLAVLRYFFEETPGLHIIAAGSLLEFALEQPEFSVPVGRIEYLHLGPMQFSEYLQAIAGDNLVEFLGEFKLDDEIPGPLHQQYLEHLHTFFITGGMPEAVKTFRDSYSWQECEAVKAGILATIQDDFNKYGTRVKEFTLQNLYKKIPLQVGYKFKYVNIDRHQRAVVLAKALHLACQARVATRIYHSSANGIPLGAEVNDKKFKVIFLDVGLMSTACGLNLLDFERAEDILLVNNGAVCEQFIGQHFLHGQEFYREPELYYWSREKKNSAAEIDYLLSHGSAIIPIEVKAGTAGSLKSLQLFLKEKNRSFGVRFNSGLPSVMEASTSLPGGKNIPFRLLSLPLYMVGEIHRLLESDVWGKFGKDLFGKHSSGLGNFSVDRKELLRNKIKAKRNRSIFHNLSNTRKKEIQNYSFLKPA